MLQARDWQRDGEDDLGSDHEVNLSWQGRFPFAHFQSGLVISTIQAKYTGISNLLIKSPQVVILRSNFLNISAYGLCGSLVNGQPGNITTKLNA